MPSCDDESYPLLRFIDPYGDTVFNRMEMQQFLREWRRLSTLARTPDQTGIVRRIERMARRCQEEPHTYSKVLWGLIEPWMHA